MNPNQKFWYLLIYTVIEKTDFPGGASGKESACHCRLLKRQGFSPWVGKMEKGKATNSRILAWRISQTDSLQLAPPGKLIVHCNCLQMVCIKVSVCRVTKNQKRLKQLSIEKID